MGASMSSTMTAAAHITTSWDDGHPLDFRVATLLAKYGLRGTFYVPRSAQTRTMTAAQVRDLSSAFEIGAHTVHHIDLTNATERKARQEIVDSKTWLEDSTGLPCSMFCPPMGRYFSRHLDLIRQAGFLGVRSVELLSLDFPRLKAGLLVLPTTLQAHPHGLAAYARNMMRRLACRNLWLYVRHGRSTDWSKLVRSLFFQALQCGGVFHLWGHSWELEETGQWQRLEEVLRFLSQFTSQAPALSNSQICELTQSQDESTERNTSVVRHQELRTTD
jgi:peptidoglycan-N-acetylglucosamine deacetylase